MSEPSGDGKQQPDAEPDRAPKRDQDEVQDEIPEPVFNDPTAPIWADPTAPIPAPPTPPGAAHPASDQPAATPCAQQQPTPPAAPPMSDPYAQQPPAPPYAQQPPAPPYGQQPPAPPYGQPQPGQQYPAYSQQYYATGPHQEANASAIVLTILSGIVMLSTCFLVGIPSLIFGIMALTSNNTDPVHSRKHAKTGWILFAVNFGVIVLLTIGFFALAIGSGWSGSDTSISY